MDDPAQACPAHWNSKAVREDQVTRLAGRAGSQSRPRLDAKVAPKTRLRPGSAPEGNRTFSAGCYIWTLSR